MTSWALTSSSLSTPAASRLTSAFAEARPDTLPILPLVWRHLRDVFPLFDSYITPRTSLTLTNVTSRALSSVYLSADST
ncbi:MAG: hypothetical protein RXP91_01730 [Nitrososphaeria archaeon]